MNRTVIRVIMLEGPHGDWFGPKDCESSIGVGDRHNVGELLTQLDHAGVIKFHPAPADGSPRYIFDIYPPANMKTRDQQTVWANMESARMRSFGYNAELAPEWKG